jgi:hypothetical protein
MSELFDLEAVRQKLAALPIETYQASEMTAAFCRGGASPPSRRPGPNGVICRSGVHVTCPEKTLQLA